MHVVRVFISFILLCMPLCNSGFMFDTLAKVDDYTRKYPADKTIDNDDWFNPEFRTVYRDRTPNWFGRMLYRAGITHPEWTIEGFRDLVKQVAAQQEIEGHLGRFVVAFKPKAGDRFFIWGGLRGALHSLVRSLENLKQEGLIDNDLNVKPGIYLVFNGNVINQSSFILETLTVILQLMKKNPTRVFYIKGTSEDLQRWHYQGLADELRIRARGISNEDIPLDSMMTRFFSTLPLALYLQGLTKESTVGLLRISYYDASFSELNEKRITTFLNTIHEVPKVQLVTRDQKETGTVNIMATIRGLDRDISFEPTEGLISLGKTNGIMEWNIFSSPTATFQRLQNFHNDAYVELLIGKTFDEWDISLYKQDIRALDGFSKSVTYNVVTGYTKKLQLESKHDVIVKFGSSMDLTKGVRVQGKAIKSMAEVMFEKARQDELIPGIIPEFEVLDDEYNPTIAKKNSERFLKEFKINKLLLPLGSPTVGASLPFVRDGQLLILFPVTGATIFRDAKLKYLLNLRGDYSKEGYLSTKYIIKNYPTTRFALFYQDDAFGQSCLQGARVALKESGIKDVLELPYERNDVNFSEQVKRLMNFYPGAIALFSTTIASEGFIRDLGIENITGKLFYGNSDLGEKRFKEFVRTKGLRVIIINVVPNPELSQLPIVKEFRQLLQQSYRKVPLDPLTLESYIGITFVFDILKRLGKDITSERIIEAMENTKNYNFGGINLTFNPETRELMSSMWMEDAPGEDWQEIDLPKTLSVEPILTIQKNNQTSAPLPTQQNTVLPQTTTKP